MHVWDLAVLGPCSSLRSGQPLVVFFLPLIKSGPWPFEKKVTYKHTLSSGLILSMKLFADNIYKGCEEEDI
jgi:hypothetical protein